jgi:para-nitrobenzyl esterase
MKRFLNFSVLSAIVFIAACAGQTDHKASATDPLKDTRWQLVKIEYMDDTTLKPDDSGKYTLAFDAQGKVSIQADCNRMSGTYTFSAPSGLEFGPLLSTRAACPPESLYNRLANDLPDIRSFVIKDGELHLALMVDGGIYHFTPMP